VSLSSRATHTHARKRITHDDVTAVLGRLAIVRRNTRDSDNGCDTASVIAATAITAAAAAATLFHTHACICVCARGLLSSHRIKKAATATQPHWYGRHCAQVTPTEMLSRIRHSFTNCQDCKIQDGLQQECFVRGNGYSRPDCNCALSRLCCYCCYCFAWCRRCALLLAAAVLRARNRRQRAALQ
jgi:hypothetical protein